MVELSVIVTAHNEGILAHKTMRSVFQALAQVPRCKHEIIVHIDKGDQDTLKYFARYRDDSTIRILTNTFGDLGLSRNYCINEAKGKYIILTDADDLISSEYIKNMLQTLKSTTDDVVAHPEYSVSFWESRYKIWHTIQPASQEETAFLLFSQNQWPSSCGAKRKVFQKYPYLATKDGYGHEDYIFNITTAAAGVRHLIAKGTVNFYRQKEQSLMRDNDAKHVTQPYSELFDFRKWQKFNMSFADAKKVSLQDRARKLYVKARYNKLLNAMIEPGANLAKKVTGKKLIADQRPPREIMQQWEEVGHIEMGLYPSPDRLKKLTVYNSQAHIRISEAYKKLCHQIKDYPDYVIVTVWMIPGGSEKVVLNYLEAIKEVHPEWKVAVITTTYANNIWRDKMPDNSYLIEMGNAMDWHFSEDDCDVLLTRLLLQLRAKKVHIINSLPGFRWADRHQELIKHQFDLYVSLFCHDLLPGTNAKGYFDYADPYARKIYPVVKAFYTDNSALPQYLAKLNGFDPKKFKVCYQPVDIIKEVRHGAASGKLNVLWASRVATQKNPKLLIRIAQKLSPETAHIDAYGRSEGECLKLKFPHNAAFQYHGAYNGLHSLDLAHYDVLLYTSYTDGLPNVILEAAAAGLVVVASDIGGVSDFIQDGETGFLVTDIENEDAYIEKLQYLRDHPELLQKMRTNAKKLLQKQHSWENFKKTIKKDFKG